MHILAALSFFSNCDGGAWPLHSGTAGSYLLRGLCSLLMLSLTLHERNLITFSGSGIFPRWPNYTRVSPLNSGRECWKLQVFFPARQLTHSVVIVDGDFPAPGLLPSAKLIAAVARGLDCPRLGGNCFPDNLHPTTWAAITLDCLLADRWYFWRLGRWP